MILTWHLPPPSTQGPQTSGQAPDVFKPLIFVKKFASKPEQMSQTAVHKKETVIKLLYQANFKLWAVNVWAMFLTLCKQYLEMYICLSIDKTSSSFLLHSLNVKIKLNWVCMAQRWILGECIVFLIVINKFDDNKSVFIIIILQVILIQISWACVFSSLLCFIL